MSSKTRAPEILDHEPEAVEYARRKAGLTQGELARRVGVTRTLITEIEGGTRNATPKTLIKLAEALDCPLVTLERKREVAPNGVGSARLLDPEAVTYAREQAGLTWHDLAQACGVSTDLMSEIAAGERPAAPEMLIRLAEALNCPLAVLESKRAPEEVPSA